MDPAARAVAGPYGAEETYYLRDPEGRLLAAYPAMGSAGFASEAVFFVLNHQDSVVGLLGADGQRVGWYRYSPYGDPIIVEQVGGAAADNPWRYLSGYHGSEAGGYHHLGARMYDNHGHFTQPDPKRGDHNNPLTTLTYGYAGCDPINSTDKKGRDFIDDAVDWVSSWNWDGAGDLVGMGLACADAAVVGAHYGGYLGAMAGGVGAPWGAVLGGSASCVAAIGLTGIYGDSFIADNQGVL